tara:strand:+ start:754 stop:1404 length:651 start_codon:yes stop_codon:yes gene_type:complete
MHANIICVKWGEKYSVKHVIDLIQSLKKYNNKFSYICYTDRDADILEQNDIITIPIPNKPLLKKWWNKLKLFDEKFPVSGKNLYFDLDVKINSDPFYVMEHIDWSKLTVVDCHWKKSNLYKRLSNYDVDINSSILAWDTNKSDIHGLWDHFYNSGYKDYFLRKYVGIDRYIVHEDFEYNTFPHDFIQSHKYEPNKKAAVTTFEEVNFEGTNIISKP